MNLFETFIQFISNLSPSLFEFFLINSVYALLLSFFVIFLKIIIPRLSKSTEYILWCVVLIRLILPIDLSFEFSIGEFIQSSFPIDLSLSHSSSEWLSLLVNDSFSTPFVSALNISFLILSLWLIVLVTSLTRYVQLKLKLHRLLTRTQPIGDYKITKEINRWRREFNIHKQVFVIKSDDFISPFTFGFLTPIIFIPERLLESDQVDHNKTIRTVIAHELMHVKRLDALWLNFQNLIQIVYCINPIVWLVVWRLNILREELCDQQVLNTEKISKEDYGKSLLQVLRFSVGSRTPELFASFFLSHKRIFKQRIKAIAKNETRRSQSMKMKSIKVVFLMSFSIIMLPIGWQHRPPVLPDTSQQNLEEKESPFPEEVRKTYKAPVVKPNR